MKIFGCLLFTAVLSGGCFAKVDRAFPESCESVWAAGMAVADSPAYRIINSMEEQHLVSVELAGSLQPIITLTVTPNKSAGCTASVQMEKCGAFSDCRLVGLTHADKDFMTRIGVEVLAQSAAAQKPEAFRRYSACIAGSYRAASKCEAKLRKEIN